MKKFLTAVLVIQMVCPKAVQTQTLRNYSYYNQKLPGDKPTIFAPGVISDGLANRDFAISPDGNEILYTIQQRDLISVIMYTHKIRGKWSLPQVAEFSGMYNDLEPAFAPDGNRLFFASNRPLTESDSISDYNIWYAERKNGNWSNPVPAGSKVNSEKDEYYP